MVAERTRGKIVKVGGGVREKILKPDARANGKIVKLGGVSGSDIVHNGFWVRVVWASCVR